MIIYVYMILSAAVRDSFGILVPGDAILVGARGPLLRLCRASLKLLSSILALQNQGSVRVKLKMCDGEDGSEIISSHCSRSASAAIL